MKAAHRIAAVAHYLMRHSGDGGGGGGASERGLRAINNAGENEQAEEERMRSEREGREGGSGRVKQSRTRGKCAPIHTPLSLRIEDHVSNQREDTERGTPL